MPRRAELSMFLMSRDNAYPHASVGVIVSKVERVNYSQRIVWQATMRYRVRFIVVIVVVVGFVVAGVGIVVCLYALY